MMRFPLRFIVPFLLLAGACGTSRQARYFQDAQSAVGDSVMTAQVGYESVIRTDDILAINVTSVSSIAVDRDPVLIFRSGGTAYNIAATQGTQGSVAAANGGFLVDAAGNIEYPLVGKVHVAGLTIEATKNLLAAKLKDYVKSPIVEVRIINYQVTVLGEVARPGIVLAPNHRISLIDALAAAGDIPITGRRDNVMVVRETGGRREFAYIDLTSRNAISSPYYYLKQNDMVIVDQSRVRRSESSDLVRIYLPIVTTLVSVIAIAYGIVRASQQ